MLVLCKCQTFQVLFRGSVIKVYATSESNKCVYMYHYGSTYMVILAFLEVIEKSFMLEN